MLARIQQLTTLGLLLFASLWAGIAVGLHRPVAAAAGALVILGGYALVLAIEFAALAYVNRHDPAPKARASDLIRAWWREVRSAPQVFCWRQPFFSRRWPDTELAAKGRRGVVFIHGFICNRGLWNRWLARLAALDVPFAAVNLEPVFGSIDDYVDLVEAAVAHVEALTGQAPIVVAHSMGGLALRRWWREPGHASRIQHAITLGTPHAGTSLAALAFTTNGRQMRRHGSWLKELAAAEPAGLAERSTCFYSHADNIVFPASTAAWPGADNRHLIATPHVAMVDHPEPMAELLRRIRS